MGATALAGVLALAVYLGPFMQSSPTPKVAQRLAETKSQEVTLDQEMKRAKRATAAAPAPPRLPGQPVDGADACRQTRDPAAQLAEPAPAPAEDAEFSLAAGKVEGTRKAPRRKMISGRMTIS
jgi:hypothetical protein